LNGECIKHQSYDAEDECPKGFKLGQSGVCMQKSTTEALFQCPEGFLPANGGHKVKDCIRTDVALQEVLCPKDFILEADRCVKRDRAALSQKCPKGYKDTGGQCVTEIVTEPELQCPPGTVEDKKKCVATVSKPPALECPKHTVMQNERCINLEEKPVNLVCPKGFHSVDTVCVTEEKFEAEEKCPPGTVPEKKKCIATEVMQAQRVECHKGYEFANGFCVKRLVERLIVECPKGYVEAEGGNCRAVEEAKPELVCNVGDLHGKHCITWERVPSSLACKDGYHQVEGDCVQVVTTEPKVKCPHGYKLGGDNHCEKPVSRIAEAVCPPGTTEKGSKCVSFVAPYGECPKHYSMDHTGRCVTTETTPYQLSCSKGYNLVGHKCKPL